MTNVAPKRRRDWRPTFLATFRSTGIVLLACHAAGISRTQAYRERQHNARFAEAWAQGEEDATEALEAEARRRALRSSDVLLIFLLKARRPAVYRDNARVEVTGNEGGPVQVDLLGRLTDEEREDLRDAIDGWLEERRARGEE